MVDLWRWSVREVLLYMAYIHTLGLHTKDDINNLFPSIYLSPDGNKDSIVEYAFDFLPSFQINILRLIAMNYFTIV